MELYNGSIFYINKNNCKIISITHDIIKETKVSIILKKTLAFCLKYVIIELRYEKS